MSVGCEFEILRQYTHASSHTRELVFLGSDVWLKVVRNGSSPGHADIGSYRSVDNGRTWAKLTDDVWTRLASNGAGVAFQYGLRYSTDQGSTWQISVSADALINNNHVVSEGSYAAVGDRAVYAVTHTVGADHTVDVFTSDDAGVTWQLATTLSDPTRQTAVGSVTMGADGVVVLGGYYDYSTDFVARSTDFGATWGTPIELETGYGTYNAATDDNGVFLLPSQNWVYRSTNNGVTWSTVNLSPAWGTVWQAEISHITTNKAGVWLASLPGSNQNTSYIAAVSTDNGATWAEVEDSVLARPGTFYSPMQAVHGDGVWVIARSNRLLGCYFSMSPPPYPPLDPPPAPKTESGTDSDVDWGPEPVPGEDPPTGDPVPVDELASGQYVWSTHYNGNQTWLALCATAPPAESFLMRSVDSAQTWALVDGSIAQALHHGVRIVGNQSGVVLAIADSGIMRSTDYGTTWANVLAAAPPDVDLTACALAMHGTTGLFAATNTVGVRDELDVYRSTDSGATWGLVHSVTSETVDVRATDIALSSLATAVVTYQVAGDTAYFQRSTNGGAAWGASTVLAGPVANIRANNVTPSDDAWVMTVGKDLWRSADNGATWGVLTLPAGWTTPADSGLVYTANNMAGRWLSAVTAPTDVGHTVVYSVDNAVSWLDLAGSPTMPTPAHIAQTVAYGESQWLHTVDGAFYLADDGFRVAAFVDVYESGAAVSDNVWGLAMALGEHANASTAVQTFWNPQAEITDSAQARDRLRLALTTLVAEGANAGDALSFEQAVLIAEVARALTQTETFYNAVVALTDVANSLDYSSYADARTVTETANAVDEALLVLTRIAQIMDEATAEDSVTPLLHLMVALSDEATAEDETLSLQHLIALIEEDAGAWATFKFADEAYTGWVMNTDGERPLSEYQGFNFNSFAEIGGRYYGAADDGLYLLEGTDDAGTPIDASIKTMMIDFGSAQQKRVQAAYLGYTASGKLLLKVRAVDGGELKEYWYEAQDLSAQAPREQMVRIGRGLRSRYWQFELVNVDGADFELDAFELYPVVLNRRV